MAYRLVAADAALGLVERRLDANDARGAAAAYRVALDRSAGPDVAADLYFSRRWAAVARNSSATISKLYYAQVAAGAASLATKSPEQQENAWYNLAILEASNNSAVNSNNAAGGRVQSAGQHCRGARVVQATLDSGTPAGNGRAPWRSRAGSPPGLVSRWRERR